MTLHKEILPPWFKDEPEQDHILTSFSAIPPDFIVSFCDFTSIRVVPILPFVLLLYLLTYLFDNRRSSRRELKSVATKKIPNHLIEENIPPGECTICLSEFSIGECVADLPCKHLFHKDCIEKWIFEGHANERGCPLCKSAVETGVQTV